MGEIIGFVSRLDRAWGSYLAVVAREMRPAMLAHEPKPEWRTPQWVDEQLALMRQQPRPKDWPNGPAEEYYANL